MTLESYLKSRLQQRRQQNRYRVRGEINSAQGPRVLRAKNELLNFCSNDYLSLSKHPEVVAAFTQTAKTFGVGSGASHLVCGHSNIHSQLEQALADFTGRDRALLFSTGYMANIGAINGLVNRKDAIFEDKLNHASLIDAGQLTGASFKRFAHNNMDQLQLHLQSSTAVNKLIVVDGVFSMDGDIAPLPQIAALAQEHQAWLMVDDAHGFGCLGQTGAGVAEHFNLSQQQLPILMATLGKALGSFGAFVAGSEALIEALIQFARPYIYTTAMPPAIAAAALASLQVVQSDPGRRQHLQSLIEYFRRGAKTLGLPLLPSQTAIQPLCVGNDAKALELSDWLLAKGLWVCAIRPPTVPVGTSRLRITLTAGHTRGDVDTLLAALAEGLRKLQLAP